MKMFNPFPLKKLNEYVIWKENKRIRSQRNCLKIMDHRFSSVILPFYAFLIRNSFVYHAVLVRGTPF